MRLKGFGENNDVLFDLAVNPLTLSCGTSGSDHMFEEFVPVAAALHTVKLFVDGGSRRPNTLPAVRRRKAMSSLPIRCAGASITYPWRETRLPKPTFPISSRSDRRGTYAGTRWRPVWNGRTPPISISTSSRGAAAIDVRILRNNGFETVEIFQEHRDFE